eukprot:3324636-Alexandrium_andersonii.AAC.1
MAQRASLAVFNAVYEHIRLHPTEPAQLSLQCRAELRAAAALLPLLRSAIHSPWCSQLPCFDASPTGFAICQREVDVDTVRELGRFNERWRFRDPHAAHARAHAASEVAPVEQL